MAAQKSSGIMGVNPDLIDYSELTEEPLKLKDLNENLVATGFRTVKFKGVEVEVLRSTPNVTDNGGSDRTIRRKQPVEWGQEMLQTCADYIVDFAEEFKKVDLEKVIHNNVLRK